MQIRTGKYFSNLDGLRFISFLFIFWGHSLDSENALVKNSELYLWIKNYVYILGKTGFSFAFVLSSYINTFVILEEKERTGTFHPLKFYIRRALRIWPLYFIMIALCFIGFPLLKSILGEPYHDSTPWWPFVTFTGNFYLINHGFPYLPAISVLWSISVEEQFYLVWPWLLWLFDKKKLGLVLLLITGFFLFTWQFYSKLNIFFHTLFMLGDIGIGAFFAFLSFQPNSVVFQKLSSLSKNSILILYIFFITSILFYHPIFENNLLPPWLNLCFERLTLASFLGFFIFEQNFCSYSIVKWGNFKRISQLGLISYGLFCFHEIGLLISKRIIELCGFHNPILPELFLKPVLGFILIVPISAISFYYFERPLLELKQKFYGK
ncbi:MAG: acyltransferase [Bacteroidia bacterium]|nr:acyltransferase [Bacteroidia bacterium]